MAYLRPPPGPDENEIESSCKRLLDVRGWLYFRLHSGDFWTLDKKRIVKHAFPGCPDYVCVHPRHVGFLLETKRAGGQLTPAQIRVKGELAIGFPGLAVVVIDGVRDLRIFLDAHEGGRGG